MTPSPPPPNSADPNPPDPIAIISEPAKIARHDPYAALRIVNYRRYFVGNAFSLIGSNMTTYVVGYELYKRTGSTLLLGLVGLVQVLPIIFLALPAGHYVDRFNRKLLILGATAGLIVLYTIMGISSRFAGDLHPAIMLAVLLLTGTCRAVNQPAKQTLVPMLVPAPHFPNAITWNATLFETSNVVGPMAGGFALAAMLGPHPGATETTWAFAILYWINAACQVVQFVNIMRIDVPHVAPRNKAGESMMASMSAGIRFVHGNKVILSAITLDMFAVLLGGATALLPVFAEHILHVGPIGLASLRAAPSVGAVAMSIVLAHSPPMKHAGRNLLVAVAGFGVAMIVFGLSRNFWFSLTALFVTGVFDNISVVVRHSLVQLLTPDSMRGRVSAVNTVFISSSNELGEFESGTTAYAAQVMLGLGPVWGPMIAVAAGGAGTIAVVIVAALLWPQLMKVKRLSDLKQSHFDPSALT